ncbi:tyrosine-type recombinase/integrase [Streptomyces sp. NPDC048361]|uniref:tyrosine-type recombinase/integrase n=1 Tax=Streptomyces sp. NPDC048361 TaxID=3154720 RepID=UPI00344217AC
MSGGANLPGAAHLVLAGEVVHLDPQSAAFQAMLDGWELQQRARFLNHEATIAPRLRLVRRFAEFTNEYPWQWQPAEAEAFLDHLRSRKPDFAFSTARGYQNALRMFCDYITDARYGWPVKCLDSFGQVPAQIFHEWNAIVHTSDYEGRPGRRPLTYDEVQALFDAADGRAEEIRARRKKGALAAMRDSTALKVVYAYGLRRQEACRLDLSDLRRNPKVLDYGRCGALFVRYGKASKGSPPKRRTVLTVPEFDWVVDVLSHYLDEVRPAFLPGKHPALWITERRGRLSLRRLDEAFEAARAAAGISEDLDLHSLRHSYVTHLLEFDYPERFVQDQVGHEYASTTAIYSGVSDDYRNRLVRKSLEARHAVLWESSSD